MLTTQPKNKRTANRKKRLQINKTTFVNLTKHAANAHNTTKQRNALQIEKTPAN